MPDRPDIPEENRTLHCASHGLPFPCATCRAESCPDIPDEAKQDAETRLNDSGVLSPTWGDWPLDGVVEQVADALAPALRKQGAEEERERLGKLREAIAFLRADSARNRDAMRMTGRPLSRRDKEVRARHEGRVYGLDEALREIDKALDTPVSSEPRLTPEEAREMYAIWLNCEIKDEVDHDHPVYTAGVKLGEMQPHPEDEGGGE
jgi:broad specificity phosphatase PhoE